MASVVPTYKIDKRVCGYSSVEDALEKKAVAIGE